MIKNAIIGLLATALLFTNTILGEYGILSYIAVSVLVFAGLCYVEYQAEKYIASVKALKRFKREVKKISQHLPTKAIS